MATIFKLIIEDDEGKTTVYPLADGDLTIGRKDGNTIRLMERNVSRRHARLERTNGAVYIQDLDSYNGVKINGERISGKYEVKEGDLVEIGDYHLALQKSVTRSEAPEPASAGTWPQAGTVPDFQLPDELLANAQRGHPSLVDPRDTLHDEPVPAGVPNIVAQTVDERPKALPGGGAGLGIGQGRLPPFPSGALPEPRPDPRAATAESSPAVPDALAPGPEVVSSVPRLVCVSTSYAGKSFALTRPELIIGRVEDNDIVIEHRSVSRNHAKILFDGRTHKIIDLQSANGILVNGEEYAMTDLRKGDLIELGHVRFRFVPADEPFRATSEEVEEMKAAGIAPPPTAAEDPDEPLDVRSDAPTDVPGYDPSQAATVTDAPLNALEPPAPSPIIEKASGPAHPSGASHASGSAHPSGASHASGSAHPSGASHASGSAHPSGASHASGSAHPSGASHASGSAHPSGASHASGSAHPSGASHASGSAVPTSPPPALNAPATRPVRAGDERPTEVNRVPSALPTPHLASSEPTARPSYASAPMPMAKPAEPLPTPQRRGPSIAAILGIIVLAVAVFGIVVFLFELIEGANASDREISALFSAKQYAEVVDYYEQNPGAFTDETEANGLYRAAQALLDKDTIEPELQAEEETPQPPLEIPAVPEPVPEPPIEEPPPVVKPPPPPVESATPNAQLRRRRAAAAAARRAAARRASLIKQLVERGKRLVINGDFARAEKDLRDCLRLDPNQPDCHRNLGVLYAQQDQTASAIKHYRRYIELRPDAGDASRVREILRKFEDSP